MGAQENKPQQIRFGKGGTRIYVIGASLNVLFTYNLSQAFDISTAQYAGADKSLKMPKKVTKFYHFNFNADGTELYAMRRNSDSIYVATLTQPFEVSATMLIIHSQGCRYIV